MFYYNPIIPGFNPDPVTAKSKCPESDLIICPETAHLGDFE